jgi:beta-lactamase regulating signal transducer with metallopeptidase domain
MAGMIELAAKLQAAHAAEMLLLLVAKATLILLIGRLVLIALPRAAAATKHAIATASLVAVAVLPLLSIAVPAWNVAALRAPEPAPARIAASRDADVEQAPTDRVAVSFAKAIAPAPVTAMEHATNVVRTTWKGMVVLTIAFIALLLFAHLLAGVLGVWFVARRAIEVDSDEALRALDAARDQLALDIDVRLLRSSRISVPLVWGVFRPVLLLPMDAIAWPAERLRVVALHELAHLKRVDGVSLIATRVAVALFWFHPLAWSLERAGRSECERACDDLVLAGGTKPSEYADHILAIARTMRGFDPFRTVTLAMSRKSQLEGRLLSILQPGNARRVFSGRAVALACVIAICLIAPVAALRLVAQPAKPQPKQTQASGSTMTVKPHVEKLEDFFAQKLSQYDTPHSAKGWYDRAYDYYRDDRYPEAAAAFRKAAEDGHDRATSLYNSACSYALANDAPHAVDALSDAFEAGWDDFDKVAEDSDFDAIRGDASFQRLLEQMGSDAATRRDRETLDHYRALRETAGPGRAGEEWFDAGDDLFSLRHLDEAIDAYQHAIAANEKATAAIYNIACAYSRKGDAANGMAWLDKALEAGFGDDEKLLSDPDLAFLRTLPSFDAAVEKAADLDLDTHEGRGRWQRWKETAEHHKAITLKYPQSGRAWFNYGYASLQAGDFAAAHEAFRRTIALRHRIGTASYNIACTYAREGNRDAAFEWLAKAREAGFDLSDAYKDEDLEALHTDARWRRVVSAFE